MSKLSQKSAVIQVTLATLSARGVSYELNGSTPISSVLTDADKSTIRNTLFSMFRKGEIEMKAEAFAKSSDDAYLKNYVSGLLNNWVRKEPEFNCGSKYQAKNPGSRQGSGDQQIREMKKLLSVTSDEKTRSVIQAEIDSRVSELKAAKNTVQIDTSKLPESLRHLAK
jgi:hypothetical protein